MNSRRLQEILQAVAGGKTTVQEALEELSELPFADLGFARLDLHRQVRTGLPEAILGSGKRLEDLRVIARRLFDAHGCFLVTRLDAESAAALREDFPEAVYQERARVLSCGTVETAAEPTGSIAVVAAGTSDLPVAEEAVVCIRWFGHPVRHHYDVGVAGLHRLVPVLPDLRSAQVVVVVAGMDGALPTVVASLVTAPVIAVPTSVGYGSSFGGLAALLTMLNSCAPGVAVVNIDNGYGAAVLASRVARSTSMASP
jgi:NCAIR mutase (PurE)-related protein